MEPRLRAADAVIFLDMSSTVCAERIVRRWWRSLFRQPLDLPAGMRHRLNRRTLWYAAHRRRWPVPAALDQLERARPNAVVVLRTASQIKALLERLGKR